MSTIIEEVEDLRSDHQGITWEQMAGILERPSGEALRSEFRRAKKELRRQTEPAPIITEPIDAQTIVFEDKNRREEVGWRELAELAKTTQAISQKLDDHQTTAYVKINTKKPIGIVFTGDWHLGDGYTDHALWLADMEFLLKAENMYIVDLGDDRQNMRNFKVLSGVLGQVLSPNHQAVLIKGIVDEMTDRKKLLAKVDGNHDVEFDERIFGDALQSYLLSKMDAPRFQNKGLLTLRVGNQEYTILMFHKSRFRSIFRGTHGAYREHQLSYPADVIAGGHDHVPGFEMINLYQMAREAGKEFGGMSYLIKTGTYQDSAFGRKYFHNGGRPMNFTVIMFPNEHKMQIFTDPYDAARYLKTF